MDEKEFSCVVVNKLSFFSFDFLLLNAEKMKAVVRENLSVYFFLSFFAHALFIRNLFTSTAIHVQLCCTNLSINFYSQPIKN